jgi:ABC-2 type transport system permease protein
VSATSIASLRLPAHAGGGGLRSAFRAERRKLASQHATRVLALVCLAGPLAFATVLHGQTASPADALLGIWVHSSGFAVSLVVLGFAGTWGFPLIAGVLAGDVFSSEDRYGTWKTVLTRSCARGEVFAGKVLAAMTVAAALLALAALSSVLAGLLLVGDQSLVGLDGALLSPGRCAALVLIAWATSLLPLLAFTSLALLFSLASRSGIVGALGPSLVALVTALLGVVGRGAWVHTLLIGSAFDGWHGVFAARPFYGPLVVCSLVSLTWTAACLGASWAILRRRDFVGAPLSRRPGWVVPARVLAWSVAGIALLALAANWGPAAVTAGRLRASLVTEFQNVAALQQRLLGRPVPRGARLDVQPYCVRRGGAPEGPGDWTCTLDLVLPQPGASPLEQMPVTYDVSAQANGCYKAESPPSFVGRQTMRDAAGRSVVNPLFVIYGCFDTL